MTLGTSFEQLESPYHKDAQCQISVHSDQWFTRRCLKFVCYINLWNLSPYSMAIFYPRDFIWTHLNLLVLGMLHATYCSVWWSSSCQRRSHFKHFRIYYYV